MSTEEQVNQGKTEDEAFAEERTRLLNADVNNQSPVEDKTEIQESDESENSDAINVETDDQSGAEQESEGGQEESRDELLQRIDKLQRALDKTNGTYGSKLADLQNQIQSLTQQRQDAVDKVEQKQATVELTDDDFSELKADFPELAPMTAKGVEKFLQRALQNMNPSQKQLSQEDIVNSIKPVLDENRQEMRREIHREILSEKHPDWNDIAGFDAATGVIKWNNLAFGSWVSIQPDEVQEEILNGNDVSRLAKHITDYKNSLKPKPKQVNLQKSVQPRGIPSGSGAGSLDPEDEAFRSEYQRLHSTT